MPLRKQILTPDEVSVAIDRIHGRELLDLLDYAETAEGNLDLYIERISEWLILHRKVSDAPAS